MRSLETALSFAVATDEASILIDVCFSCTAFILALSWPCWQPQLRSFLASRHPKGRYHFVWNYLSRRCLRVLESGIHVICLSRLVMCFLMTRVHLKEELGIATDNSDNPSWSRIWPNMGLFYVGCGHYSTRIRIQMQNLRSSSFTKTATGSSPKVNPADTVDCTDLFWRRACWKLVLVRNKNAPVAGWGPKHTWRVPCWTIVWLWMDPKVFCCRWDRKKIPTFVQHHICTHAQLPRSLVFFLPQVA